MSFPNDVRLGLRNLLRERAYTAIALATLAFGIAANTVIFSVVDAVLLRPLGYRDPATLVVINEVVSELARQYPRLPVSGRHYFEWRDHGKSFDGLGIVEGRRSVLTGLGEPEQLQVARVSSNLLPMLGARLQIGRQLLEQDDQPGRNTVVVITDALWNRRFNRDRTVIGRSVTLDGVPHTVVGVLAPGFELPRSGPDQVAALPYRADVYKPIALRREALDWFGPFNYTVIARLRSGVSESQAAAELNVLQAGIASRLPDKMHLGVLVRGLQDEVTGASRMPLLVLLGAAGAVLLVVCVNLANLSLARGVARSRDVAIRLALGATRAQLIRGVLTESVCLALTGGALGAALSWAGIKTLVARAPLDLPRLAEIRLDARVLLFALGVAVLTGLLFGILPAWRAAGIDPQRSLNDGSRTSTDGPGARLVRQSLVGLESALAACLLIVAGLLLGSFFRLLSVDKGFDAEHVVTAQITLPPNAYPRTEALNAYYRDVVEKLHEIPGGTSSAIVSHLPLEGEDWVDLVRKAGDKRSITEVPPANYRFCSPECVKTRWIPLAAGRQFTDADRTRPLAVISEATARAVWPNENPIGKTFTRNDPKGPSIEVAGVVPDVSTGLASKPVATVFMPYWTSEDRVSMELVLRGAADPRSVVSSMRRAVWSVNPDTVVDKVRTLDDVVSESVAGRRFQVLLTAGFAASTLLLACLGIYGVVSWSVARRRQEIGLRMALGAGAGDVWRMVVVQGMRPVLAGLALGVLGALALSRVLNSLLFGVSSHDPLTIVLVTLVLGAVAALACYLPARRASLGDPLRALRYE
jgi:putative ABC transport system permease protein